MLPCYIISPYYIQQEPNNEKVKIILALAKFFLLWTILQLTDYGRPIRVFFSNTSNLPYTRHYNPRPVYFLLLFKKLFLCFKEDFSENYSELFINFFKGISVWVWGVTSGHKLVVISTSSIRCPYYTLNCGVVTLDGMTFC